jgi:hypothetical protein
MLKRHFYLITFALTFALTVMLGCARPTESPDPLANTANVRVLHFSPGAPAVNLQINGSRPRVAPGSTAPDTIRYLDNRPYYNVPAGPVVVSLTSARTFAIPNPPPLSLSTTIQAEGNQTRYTVALTDTFPSTSLTVYRDTSVAPTFETIPPGRSLVRVVHLSRNAPAVRPVLRVSGGSDSVRTFSDISFRQASGYLLVNSGTGTLQLLNPATQAPITSFTVAVPGPGLGSAAPTPGFIYTIYVRGLVGATGATALGTTVVRDN